MAENAQNQAQPATLKGYLFSDPTATTCFFLRMVTLVCSIAFVFTGLGFSLGMAYKFYVNAMLAAFFTFAIRMYQRAKAAQVSLFSMQFIQLLMVEDSFHYMLYTFFFYNQIPQIVYVIPIFLYAVLFSTKYVNGLLKFLPTSVQTPLHSLVTLVGAKQSQMHRMIAYCEVLMMPIIIMNIFSGSMFFLAPLLYFQFLKLRYTSRRNPSVRLALTEMRLTAQYLAQHPKCPGVVGNVIKRLIQMISSLAPPVMTAQPNQSTGQAS